MKYKLTFDKKILNHFKKMDKHLINMLMIWIGKNLNNTTNPRIHGKPLSYGLNKYWRYRIGDYRLIARIDDKNHQIIVFHFGHRSSVYKKIKID